MPGRNRTWVLLAGLLLVPAFALTQDAPRGQERSRRGVPTQMRERMMTSLKEQMGANDEDWKALAPKIEKVYDLQRELRMGRFGRRAADSEAPASKLEEAERALRSAIENPNTAEPDLKQKLAAYREARDKAQEELQKAQQELKEGRTARQEAVLVVNGLID